MRLPDEPTAYQIVARLDSWSSNNAKTPDELRDAEGLLLFETLHNGDEPPVPRTSPGRYLSRAVIPADFLAPTAYELAFDASIAGIRHCIPKTLKIPLTVQTMGLVNRAYPEYRTPGRLTPRFEWRTDLLNPATKE